ncbi:MAG TPA: GNAT family N-acetyltransferase [Longimicrobium sp.]|nr:GNAT family N-acetyltransferase [Longimicrobium sp.]
MQIYTTQVTLRPATDDDLPFLERLYGTVRAPELAPLPWTQAQKDEFVRHQFNAQHTWWHEQYEDTTYDVVLVNGVPAGRLYVGRWQSTIRVVDIALLPEHRGGGLGTRLMNDVLAEGDAAGKPVSIHVERYNPAMRLYERLGFVEVEDKGVYVLMERPVGGKPARA